MEEWEIMKNFFKDDDGYETGNFAVIWEKSPQCWAFDVKGPNLTLTGSEPTSRQDDVLSLLINRYGVTAVEVIKGGEWQA